MKFNGNLYSRTPGETLWIARKAAGLTQALAASRAGLGENAYGDAEKDRNRRATPLKIGVRPVSRPSLPVLLTLARRRSGLKLSEVARRLGVSKVTVHGWERSGRWALKEFWERRGFTFP